MFSLISLLAQEAVPRKCCWGMCKFCSFLKLNSGCPMCLFVGLAALVAIVVVIMLLKKCFCKK